MNELRDTADHMIEDYRTKAEWSVASQIVLRCVNVLYMENFTAARISALSHPLVGEHLAIPFVSVQLGKMRKAGLLRTRRVNGVCMYEVSLPF